MFILALTVHNSLTVSLPAPNLPLSPIFHTVDSLPASGLTPQIGPFLRGFLFFFHYSFCFFLIPCGRLSCLPVSFWAHEKLFMVPYRIVSYRKVSGSTPAVQISSITTFLCHQTV